MATAQSGKILRLDVQVVPFAGQGEFDLFKKHLVEVAGEERSVLSESEFQRFLGRLKSTGLRTHRYGRVAMEKGETIRDIDAEEKVAVDLTVETQGDGLVSLKAAARDRQGGEKTVSGEGTVRAGQTLILNVPKKAEAEAAFPEYLIIITTRP